MLVAGDRLHAACMTIFYTNAHAQEGTTTGKFGSLAETLVFSSEQHWCFVEVGEDGS